MAFTTRVGLGSILALLLAAACTGETPGAPTPPQNSTSAGSAGTGGMAGTGGGSGAAGTGAIGPDACNGGVVPGRSPLRRLTATEYNNTVHDILGDTAAPGDKFPPAEEGSGFANDADAYKTTLAHAQGWLAAAESLASAYRTAGKLSLSCSNDAQNCAAGFITNIGKKLFRRPLTDAEVASYLTRFSAGSAGGSFEEGLEWVLGRMLMSPYFLYRVELESAGKPRGTVVPLNDYSIATRLSYFLWSSTPDDELMAAADAQELSKPDGVATQVKRMMGSPASPRRSTPSTSNSPSGIRSLAPRRRPPPRRLGTKISSRT